MANIEYVVKQLAKSKTKGTWKNRADAVAALRKVGAVTKDIVSKLIEERDGRWVLTGLARGEEAKEAPKTEDAQAGGASDQAPDAQGSAEGASAEPDAPTDASLAGASAPKGKKSSKKPAAKAVKTGTKKGPSADGKVTVSSYMRELIRKGLANADVFEKAKEKFPELDDKKKGYPAWYRSHMRADGENV